MSLILNGTTGISDVDGTAAAPALTGTDTNTGIFFPAADTIGFSEGGAEAMRIDSSGNVGIGTASPGAKFSLTSTGSTTADGVRLTFGSEARAHNIYSALSTGRDLTIAPFRALTINTGSGTAEGVLALNAYEYTTFGTGSSYTERARIDSSGNLLVGTTSSSGLITGVQASTSAYAGYFTSNYTASGNANLMFWGRSGGAVAAAVRYKDATTTMEFYSPTGQTVAYTTSSDYRIKKNVQTMTGALAKVSQLRPVTYTWKEGFGVGESEGFIAHELQAVVPDCVSGEKDAVDADGNPQYQGIDTSFLIATLSAAIQELHALVKMQDSTITALTTRITALEAA